MRQTTNIYAQDENFWKLYLQGRPQVPDSFFDRIFQYHADHGGRFDTVHDAGAGAAVHSARLAARFDNVIVTDKSLVNIRAAKAKLRGCKYAFEAVKLEETVKWAPKSVDMVLQQRCCTGLTSTKRPTLLLISYVQVSEMTTG